MHALAEACFNSSARHAMPPTPSPSASRSHPRVTTPSTTPTHLAKAAASNLLAQGELLPSHLPWPQVISVLSAGGAAGGGGKDAAIPAAQRRSCTSSKAESGGGAPATAWDEGVEAVHAGGAGDAGGEGGGVGGPAACAWSHC
jgi:hypothetical protein